MPADSRNIEVTIIGGGLTGLATAHFLRKEGASVRIVESQGRTGGVISTLHDRGFHYEAGPNTGLVSNLAVEELLDDLSEYCEAEYARPESKKRYIWKAGQWRALPSGVVGGISTPLFSAKDKIRILFEPFRSKGKDPMESVASMVSRRLGKSYLSHAVDPFISGVYAGDPEYLVTQYALPKLYRLEQDYGSFIGGAIRKARERKARGEKKPAGGIFSCRHGLGRLIEALNRSVGEQNILLSGMNTRISPGDGIFTVSTQVDGKPVEWTSNQVITTTGSDSLRRILPFVKDDYLHGIERMEYASVVQVAAGFRKWNGMPLDAYGGLIPSAENRRALGILFPSSIFHERAPEGGALLSVFLGGFRHPEMYALTDAEIEDIVIREISETLRVRDPRPEILNIFRYKRAIPQYGISSRERYENIRQIEHDYPGLHIAGNLRDGIGMADRIAQARSLAGQTSSLR